MYILEAENIASLWMQAGQRCLFDRFEVTEVLLRGTPSLSQRWVSGEFVFPHRMTHSYPASELTDIWVTLGSTHRIQWSSTGLWELAMSPEMPLDGVKRVYLGWHNGKWISPWISLVLALLLAPRLVLLVHGNRHSLLYQIEVF